ncbi:DUF4097 family beta strand repeat-containing protein [Nonomuraea jiangxiensis]|nr:DUF4097 family beta strand repeat-containing protein [Nonomuraea jiangxiensis]
MRQIAIFAACASVVALATGGCGVDLDADEVHTARSFSFTGTELKIRSSLGGLRVLPGTGGAVVVERWVRGKAAGEGNATWSLRDGTLRLGANCTMILGDCGARYHVKVPPGVRLSIDTVDGVILKDLTQDVDVSTREHIQVSGASGKLRLLSEGPITGERLRSANVRCRTSDGAIKVTFDSPPTNLDLQSRDGRVTATVPRDSYAVTTASKEGEDRSELKDTKSPRTIVARSTTGDVQILARGDRAGS